METQECLVKIGDRIVGKKTGQMIPSTVFGIITADFYMSRMSKVNDFSKWDELYPDWKDNVVVLAMFDEPQKNISVQETWEFMRENSKIFQMLEEEKTSYKILNEIVMERWNNYPSVDSVAYPIDDVDIL